MLSSHNYEQAKTSASTSCYPLVKGQQGPRILIADDDPNVFVPCQQMLQQSGYVMKVSSQERVLALLENHLFDLVIVGLHATTLSGLELLEQIRHHSFDVPVVVVVEQERASEQLFLHLIAQAVKLGVQGLVFKPLTASELQKTITDTLNKHQRETNRRWHMIQQLVQTEKLATAGRIVASIAHEMNNPLQALHNALHLLGKRSFNGRKRQQYLAMAQEEVGNLIQIVRRMLDLYRPASERMRPTNMNTLLESTLRRVDKDLHGGKVRVLRDWCPRLPSVFAIGSRLKQVCLDLVTNAIQAMPNGGTLTIRTYATNGTEYQINAGVEFHPTGAAGYQIKGPAVVVEISDTGLGIAPDALPKVFEPFYTTRFNASGLGLAISYSIVEQHHGEISVSSTEGQGTTVRLRLPAAM